MPEKHSRIVGGSTAKQVMHCPGSVKLCQQMPIDTVSTPFADRGTLLHTAVADVLENGTEPAKLIGVKYKDEELTRELHDDKLVTALELFDAYMDEVDPAGMAEYMIESEVGFGKFIPGVFGSCDVLSKAGSRAVVLDWKFGDGVPVEADDNYQLLFYAAAARRTERTKWVFEDVTEVELVIIQPPAIKRWVTTIGRLDSFEQELKAAVKLAAKADAPLQQGEHCRWCKGKPICPKMTGAVDRALQLQLKEVDVTKLGKVLHQAVLLEQWLDDLRRLSHLAMENGVEIPGWKLVNKRGTRQWVEPDAVVAQILAQYPEVCITETQKTEVLSPAQMEKMLKKKKLSLPEKMVTVVSSGTTIAPVEDPRPAAVMIGDQLAKALNNLK